MTTLLRLASLVFNQPHLRFDGSLGCILTDEFAHGTVAVVQVGLVVSRFFFGHAKQQRWNFLIQFALQFSR